MTKPTGPADWTPDHYRGEGMQPFDVINAFALDFYEGNALKYLLRWRKKNGVEDLCKARTYLQVLIDQHGDEPEAAKKDAPAVCCVCGEGPVTYRNYREQPFCSPCADPSRAEADARVSQMREALGLDNDPGIDVLGTAREIRRELDRTREAIRSVLHVHRSEVHQGMAICVHCSSLDEQGSTDNSPVAYPCETVQRIRDDAKAQHEIDNVKGKEGPR